MEELLHKLGVDWRLLIAQLVNFIILFVLLKKLLYRPVLDLLERRRKLIEEGLQSAERSQERLAGIELERKQALEAAALERQHLLEAAAREAEQIREHRLLAAGAEVAGILARAKDEAARTREELFADVRREVGDLVLSISRKVTAERLPKAVHDDLVSAAIEEMKEISSVVIPRRGAPKNLER